MAYARDGDELVISTPGATFKRASIEADERVNLCVISNAEPFNFVAIEAKAMVTRAQLEADTRKVFCQYSRQWPYRARQFAAMARAAVKGDLTAVAGAYLWRDTLIALIFPG